MKRPPEKLLSVREASALSGVTEGTLYRLIWSDKIPHERIGAQVVISSTVAERLRKYREKPEGHITIAEAMEIAGVSRSRVSQLVKNERVKATKRKWLNTNLVWIDKASLKEWIEWRDWEKNKLARMTEEERIRYKVLKEAGMRIVRNYKQRRRRKKNATNY